MQELGEKEIKADEEKTTDENKMDKNFFMAPINIQMVAIDIKVFIFCVCLISHWNVTHLKKLLTKLKVMLAKT